MKKLGKEYLWAENEAQNDFLTSARAQSDLLCELDKLGLQKGAVLGGALTQIITHLIAESPDVSTAMGLLTSCINNATTYGNDFYIIFPHSSKEIH